ncbi:MAG: S-layer homology domain-containing protein [Thermoleophilia bacterium]
MLLILAAVLVLARSVAPASAFSDVSAEHPYAAAINDLFDKQIVSGYMDGSFGPENPAMRQHYAKMIVLSLGLPVSEADVCTFGDVLISGPESLYPDNYIAVAASNLITKGTGPGHFSPDSHITRAQAITMVVRALERLKPGTLSPPPAGFGSTWGDFSPDHAVPAATAEANGLLAGLGANALYPGGDLTALDPFGDMSRGEIAQLLHNLVVMIAPPPEPPPTDYPAIHSPDAALSSTYASCAGASCHELNLFSQHVVKLGLPCTTCHASTRPEVAAAIAAYGRTGVKQGCRACHGPDAGRHEAAHELDDPVPTACILCHARNLIAEHVTAHQVTCAACHGPGASPAAAAVVATFGGSNPLNPICTDCHAVSHADLAARHTASELEECRLCHRIALPDEHARASSTGAGSGCATCHPLPQAFSGSGLCADCHKTGGAAPVRHLAIEGAHNSVSSCAIPGCHATDLRVVHQGASEGCGTCHSSTKVPITSKCTDCHAAAHAALTAAHTEAEAQECRDCHLMVLPDEHARSTSSSKANGCQNCHPLPGGFVSTKTCADCHTVGGAAPVRHAGIESAHAVSAGCGGSGCHPTDVRTIHQGTANGCKTCHSTTSVPTTTQCSSCHPSTPHEVREPYRDSCANCHEIKGPGEQLHDWHVNRGYACAECHGASAPGCANGSCHEHSKTQIHDIDEHPTTCTYCHKSGTP